MVGQVELAVVPRGPSRTQTTQPPLTTQVESTRRLAGACSGGPSDSGDLAGLALFSGPARTVTVGPIGREPVDQPEFSQERGLRFSTAARIVTYGSSDVLLLAGNGCRGATALWRNIDAGGVTGCCNDPAGLHRMPKNGPVRN